MTARHYFSLRRPCRPATGLLFTLLIAVGSCGPNPDVSPDHTLVTPAKSTEPAASDAQADLSTQPPPNIVLFLADDLGMGDLSYLGGQPQTPHIDQLAEDGIRLSNFHAFPVCSPSRAALLTGKSPLRLGLAWTPLPPWSERGLPEGVATLADLLKAQNYYTAMIGKWHLGHSTAAQHPNQRGFDHFYGCITGAVDYWTHKGRRGGLDWQRNGKSLDEQGYATELIAQEANHVIQEHDFAAPLFLYVPFTAPHQPLQAPQESLAEYQDISDPSRQTYCAMVSEMDRAIGSILQSLSKRGQDQNTLIVFLSDNGGARDQGANNGAYRNGKGSVFEGGLKVPAIIHWPANLDQGRQLSEFTSLLDLAPTLYAATGKDVYGMEWDGRNLLPQLSSNSPKPTSSDHSAPSTAFVALNETRAQMAVFQSGWKYVRRVDSPDQKTKEWLFQLSVDPQEKTNLAKANPDRIKLMREELQKWLALDPLGANINQPPAPKEAEPKGWNAPKDWASR